MSKLSNNQYFNLATSEWDFEAMKHLSPELGIGYSEFNLDNSLPEYFRSRAFANFYESTTNGVWAIGGDPNVDHYIDVDATAAYLIQQIGENAFMELSSFAKGITELVAMGLPRQERDHLEENGLKLELDLAELRIADGHKRGFAHRPHVDWFDREAMVMVIPILGQGTILFSEGIVDSEAAKKTSLFTGFGRWQLFNQGWEKWLREKNVPISPLPHQNVPRVLLHHISKRGVRPMHELTRGLPGVVPTVHAAAKGARVVMVLNLRYGSVDR